MKILSPSAAAIETGPVSGASSGPAGPAVTPFGPIVHEKGVRFRFWAPGSAHVRLKIEGEPESRAMIAGPDGWHEADVPGAGPGMRYLFVLGDGRCVPDPASRYQPCDVHGPSEVVDAAAFAWTDRGWRGRPWEETVFYEIHVGTFTKQGTYRAAIGRLDHLVELGATAVQIMPLHDFPGRFGWGYDGAFLYAPDAAYGSPDELRALVDACHARGLMVFLDVVYNHFGPEGNHFSSYAPVESERHEADFGTPPNVDGEAAGYVRDFLIGNALLWLGDFHMDGLRLDAAHAIPDSSEIHVLAELADAVRAAFPHRHVHLVLENSENQAGWYARGAGGAPRHYTAQWADDIHHALHVQITGEPYGYYADYREGLGQLGRAMAEGFWFQGDRAKTDGRVKGEKSAGLPPTAFVAYVQNHDQTGNRPFGERIADLVAPRIARAAATLVLLSPHIPLVFMGEDWAASAPFLYFTDVEDDLRPMVRAARLDQLADYPGKDNGFDPFSRKTFDACRLDWSEAGAGFHAETFAFYRDLIAARNAHIVPLLAGARHGGTWSVVAGHVLELNWALGGGATLSMLANLHPEPVEGIAPWRGRHVRLTGSAGPDGLGGWSVIVNILGADGSNGAGAAL